MSRVDELPKLPKGLFWRIFVKDEIWTGLILVVQLRKRKRFLFFKYSDIIYEKRTDPREWDGDHQDTAIELANRIAVEYHKYHQPIQLGELYGDHPPD